MAKGGVKPTKVAGGVKKDAKLGNTKAFNDDIVGKALEKKVPKSAMGRRIMKKRESQVVEDAKTALIMRGNNSTVEVNQLLQDFHKLRRPLAALYMRKHPEHPFEDSTKLEKLCKTNDHGMFVFGSSSKKRPFRVIMGRMFDGRLLDMNEYNIADFVPSTKFQASKRESVVGSKPLMIFQGSGFDTNESLKRTKSLLLDYFGAGSPDKVLLSGLDQVMVCSTFDDPAATGDAEPTVQVKRFHVRHLKSGSKLPRAEMEEMGPSFKMTLDRSKTPDKDLWKASIKVPKAAKPSKVKNVSKDEMGKRSGKLHMGRQDFNQIHTVHHGQSKRKKMAAEKVAGEAKPVEAA